MIPAMRSTTLLILVVVFVALASPAEAFGAGYVPRGSSAKGTNYRHGDILYSVYFLKHAHATMIRGIYFGNWLRDFSQLMDRKALEIVPEEILRAVVAIFAYIQFGYTTAEFEVTQERLGYYRPEEHVDNPKGYEGGTYTQLRPAINPQELEVDPTTGMKNYVANKVGDDNPETSRDYIDKQLVAAIACARVRDAEAYVHLGGALHALEDFVAHSNWVELCMQMLSSELVGSSEEFKEMANVFPFTGGAASVKTARGRTFPLVTGTFGALDLYQTVLGEFDDKLSSMSLPGIQKRIKSSHEELSSASEMLITIFNGLDNNNFASDVTSITKSATEEPADWGKLNEAPELLWKSLYPVFRLRDKIVRWVHDNLTVDAVANAVVTISAALDKLVYRIIGTFFGPVMQDLSKVLMSRANSLLAEDQQARLARGEQSVFENDSTATDPTHSQLCKDHYDHDLNELAGRVASKITTFTIKKIIEVWQPGSTVDVRPTLDSILSALHHPFNHSKENEIQALMVAEVLNWCTTKQQRDPIEFKAMLSRLNRPYLAAKQGEESEQIAHSHVPAMTATYGASNQISSTTAHDLTTVDTGGDSTGFVERITANIEKGLKQDKFTGLTISDLPGIKQLMQAKPSADAPNPIDESLLRIPGMSLSMVFDGIDAAELAAAPGMGIILKDSVIEMRLRDESWVEAQQIAAREQLGALEDRPVKEMLELLDFGTESKSSDRPIEGESKTTRLLNKLKIGSSRDIE